MKDLYLFSILGEDLNANDNFYIVNCCRNSYSKENFKLNRTRTDWSICIVTHGELSLPLTNERIEKDNIYIFPPNTYQKVFYKTNSLTYWLHVKGKEADKIMQEINVPFNTACEIHNRHATSIMDKIITEYLSKDEHYEEIACLLAKNFLYNIPREINIKNTNTAELLKKVLHKLYLNPKLSNDECAKLCLMTTENFIRVFKDHYHLTPHKFKQRLIISRAKELLKKTNYTINQIAILLGFDNNPLYFSTYFKSLTGIYPVQYRKNLLSDQQSQGTEINTVPEIPHNDKTEL